MKATYSTMHQIKRALGGKVGAESLERSLALVETTTPIGALMATVAPREFTPAIIEAARERPAGEKLAWLTLGAAGAVRTRLALAGRAVELVDPDELIEVVVMCRGSLAPPCAERAERASGDEEWGAWLLLGRLRRGELRALIEARPELASRYREARSRGRVNPQIAVQLRAHGLL